MRTNTPVGDYTPFLEEEEHKTVPEDSLQKELGAIGASAKWPETTTFIKERQEFYRRYLPGGKALDTISPEDRGSWWLCASTMIAEFDAFMDVINEVTDAKRRTPPSTTEV